MADLLTAAAFPVGERLTVRLDDADPLELEIVEVVDLPGEVEARRPFSVLFAGPAEPLLPQRIYAVDHPERGPLEIFLVPLGPRERGGLLYEAVFA